MRRYHEHGWIRSVMVLLSPPYNAGRGEEISSLLLLGVLAIFVSSECCPVTCADTARPALAARWGGGVWGPLAAVPAAWCRPAARATSPAQNERRRRDSRRRMTGRGLFAWPALFLAQGAGALWGGLLVVAAPLLALNASTHFRGSAPPRAGPADPHRHSLSHRSHRYLGGIIVAGDVALRLGGTAVDGTRWRRPAAFSSLRGGAPAVRSRRCS